MVYVLFLDEDSNETLQYGVFVRDNEQGSSYQKIVGGAVGGVLALLVIMVVVILVVVMQRKKKSQKGKFLKLLCLHFNI